MGALGRRSFWLGLPLVVLLATAAEAGAARISEFTLPRAGAGPYEIIGSPDGALSFTEAGAGRIGRLPSGGAVTESGRFDDVGDLARGSDGNLWFTEPRADKVGRVTPAGALAEFALPAGTRPLGIAAGPDGALWVTSGVPFADGPGPRIWRIAVSGARTAFTSPGEVGFPYAITAGPDGALWFTSRNANRVGRISTTGSTTSYATGGITPRGITTGPDGAIWVAGFGGIARITPAGALTVHPLSGAATAIATGPDGNLWFTQRYEDRVGRITPAGAVTTFPLPVPASEPTGIARGADGALWVTEFAGNRIARIPTDATPGRTRTLLRLRARRRIRRRASMRFSFRVPSPLPQPAPADPLEDPAGAPDGPANFVLSIRKRGRRGRRCTSRIQLEILPRRSDAGYDRVVVRRRIRRPGARIRLRVPARGPRSRRRWCAGRYRAALRLEYFSSPGPGSGPVPLIRFKPVAVRVRR